jgi:hypothetical protein
MKVSRNFGNCILAIFLMLFLVESVRAQSTALASGKELVLKVGG